MAEPTDPLRLTTLPSVGGMRLLRQSAPAGAGSFSATYVGPAGWGHDPRGAEGAARLVGQLAVCAAGPYDRVELARRLDRAGATLSSQVAPESAELSVWGPADLWEELVGLLALAVLRPRFDADDVRRARRQLAERQLREASQPAQRAERELLRASFPVGHPYGGTGIGTARSLGRLGRATLARFHREHFTADGGLLVVTGPRAPAVERLARRLFASLPSTSAPALRTELPARGAGGRRTLNLPGRSQVEVRVGGPSIPRGDPRFPAAFLANEVLGGRPLLSRLFQRVREHGGLAYHAGSELEAMRFGGYWMAGAGTGADRWRKVVPMLEQEVGRMRDVAPSAAELDLVRESAIGELPLSLESTSDAHELAVDAAYNGLPDDHWLRWPATLRAVRPAELRDAARAAFGSAGSVTVVAGPVGASSGRRGSA
jgi:zinc protease